MCHTYSLKFESATFIESLRPTFADVPEQQRRKIFGEKQIEEPLALEQVPRDSHCYLFTTALREAAEHKQQGA